MGTGLLGVWAWLVVTPVPAETRFAQLAPPPAIATDADAPPQEVPIPEEEREAANRHREYLIERVVEQDETLTERYLEGEPISVEELRAALRQASLDRSSGRKARS